MKRAWRFRTPRQSRRGVTAVLVAVLMVLILGMVAFALDLGYMMLIRTQMQAAVDSGALAGAGMINEGELTATTTAQDFALLNAGQSKAFSASDMKVEFGEWDVNSRKFIANAQNLSAIRVTANSKPLPVFFGRIFGQSNFTTSASAVATFQPRDIQVVLDFSGSMCSDSQLSAVSDLGKTTVEGYLAQMYADLGSPKYGNMTWLSSAQWSNQSTNWIIGQLGLTNVPFPYPSGSWSDYIKYVKGDGGLPSSYEDRYGYMTWLNYRQEQYPAYEDSPDLWKTSEQPVGALKESVKMFMAYLQEVDSLDRVGLVVYTSSDGTAKLEQTLTYDLPVIYTLTSQRQAGHYSSPTNIGDGIKRGREDLVNKGRQGAKKLMVLITDGLANRPNGKDPVKYMKDQAKICADNNIPIVAISLGSGADADDMQAVADLTGGAHFNIPGGQTAAQYEDALKEIFKQVAQNRGLKLVQ